MSLSVMFSARPGRSVISTVSALSTPAYLVEQGDTRKTRCGKLQRQDELYRCWLASAQDPTKSSDFPNGSLSGHLSGYQGSLLFTEDGGARLVFAHCFEDCLETELDLLGGALVARDPKSALELARAFQQSEGLRAFEAHLSEVGFRDIVSSCLRFKQGG